MDKVQLTEIGYQIGYMIGRDFEYFDEKEDVYVFFFFNEFSEYVEIPKDQICDYKELEFEVCETAI